MNRCYRERLSDIVVMASPDGTRAAAEFTVNGTYLATDEGLPEARGQTYVLPAGGFSLHPGRADRAGGDLLQPRRLGAAGLAMSLVYREYLGPAIADVVAELAQLRVTVFRDWPYLYDGDAAYERGYLARYARGDSIVVAAYDGDRMVGAATGMPLTDHADDFAAAFSGTDIDMKDVFYCAESVLLSEYRGQGAGHAFFDRREAHAARLGFGKVAFCGVVRPADHPAGPRVPPARRVLARTGIRAA
jgi:GNAT superfamily N-acetyltransferase